MQQLSHILADGGEDPTVKIIIGAIVAAIYVISHIAGALKKTDKRRLPPPTVRQPSRVPTAKPQAARSGVPKPALKQTARPSLGTPPVRRVQPPPLRSPAAPAMKAPQPAGAAALARSTAAASGAASVVSTPAALERQAFLKALLQPRNLKKGFVLTEILQPPVALRDASPRSI